MAYCSAFVALIAMQRIRVMPTKTDCRTAIRTGVLRPGQSLPTAMPEFQSTIFSRSTYPDAETVGGVVKPDVVFFGEAVPELRVTKANNFLRKADALMVVGSSLMVFSGYRFARIASEAGKPIAIVNRGTTRADDLATHKLTANCAELLSQAVGRLAA